MNDYNVLVTFRTPHRSTGEIVEELTDAVSVEQIDANEHEVGYSAVAPSSGAAFKRVVDYIEASLALANCTTVVISHADVYGPHGHVLFDC